MPKSYRDKRLTCWESDAIVVSEGLQFIATFHVLLVFVGTAEAGLRLILSNPGVRTCN